jgi:acylphosphatase
MRARRYLVDGEVQGVFYRASARAEALRLGLDGWVRNLRDGRVEAWAVGHSATLDAFEIWLRRGPPRARVAALTIVDEAPPDPVPRGFEVR